MDINESAERVRHLYSGREFGDIAKQNYIQGASDMRQEARDAFLATIIAQLGCTKATALPLLDAFIVALDKQ